MCSMRTIGRVLASCFYLAMTLALARLCTSSPTSKIPSSTTRTGALRNGSGWLGVSPEYGLYREPGGDWTELSNSTQQLFSMPAGYFYMPISLSEQTGDCIMLPLLLGNGQLSSGADFALPE